MWAASPSLCYVLEHQTGVLMESSRAVYLIYCVGSRNGANGTMSNATLQYALCTFPTR